MGSFPKKGKKITPFDRTVVSGEDKKGINNKYYICFLGVEEGRSNTKMVLYER